MKGTNLGEFEELALLIVGVLADDAYGAAVIQELELRTGRNPSVGAVHSALNRLIDKGFIKSEYGAASEVRRGRRKVFYKLTPAGETALIRTRELRNRLFDLIPKLSS
ncbi:MAG: helix-turn-helix transcriptional regulator [Bacteroidota bacterium]